MIAGLILIVILAAVLFLILRSKGERPAGHHEGETETTAEIVENISKEEIQHNAVIDLSQITGTPKKLSVQGMKPTDISRAITDSYDWKLAITNKDANVGAIVKPTADANQTTEAATMGDAENPDFFAEGSEENVLQDITVIDRIEVKDFIAERIPALIEEIVARDEEYKESLAAETTTVPETTKKKLFAKETTAETTETEEETEAPEEYVFELDGVEEELAKTASYAEQMWYVEPLGGSIGSYDRASDTFVMEGAKNGFKVDEEHLREELLAAWYDRNFDKEIPVTGEVLSGEAQTNASEYRIIASYTTNTTSNSVRNKNIALAAEKLNGTIVRPGEEFSFNNAVGERTEAKGFGAAAAYNNGEVVQEIGGGVCQVSTTLYNAAVKAGLKITYRQGHTFQPTYVTPGQDATISWGGPDFRFANLPAKPEYSRPNTYAIGIKASYYNQQVTVQIYGRPVLQEGITYSLSSEKTQEMEIVRKLIEPGSDKTPTSGSKGSIWETKLIIKNGDQVVSNARDHTTIYTGHIEYYTDQTTAESSSEVPSEIESISDEPLDPGNAEGPGGPGGPGNAEGPGAGPGPGSVVTTAADETHATEVPTTAVSAPGDNDGPSGSSVGSNTPDGAGNDSPGAPVSSGNTPGEIVPGGNAPGDAGIPDNHTITDGPGGNGAGSVIVEGGPGSFVPDSVGPGPG